MKLHVEYFASLRECAAKSSEEWETDASTALELYSELQQRYRFPLTPEQIKVAINDRFEPFQTALKSGDRIVFIPPIAGG